MGDQLERGGVVEKHGKTCGNDPMTEHAIHSSERGDASTSMQDKPRSVNEVQGVCLDSSDGSRPTKELGSSHAMQRERRHAFVLLNGRAGERRDDVNFVPRTRELTRFRPHEVPRGIVIRRGIRRRYEEDSQRSNTGVIVVKLGRVSRALQNEKRRIVLETSRRRASCGWLDEGSVGLLHDVHLRPLATTASSLGCLLATLHRGLHVVPAPLELAENSLSGHLPLEVLDRALDSFVTHGDFERFALNGVGRHF
jgi:hypothetical protein